MSHSVAQLPSRPPRSSLDAATLRIPVVCGLAIILVSYLSLFTAHLSGPEVSYGVFLLLGGVAIVKARRLRDLLNPLSLLIFLCLIRIALPAVALPSIGSLPDSVIHEFGITTSELVQGQHLATIGLLAVLLGWYLCPLSWGAFAFRGFRWAGRALRPDPRLVESCILVFACGVAATWVFLAVNFGDPLAAYLSGVARGDAAPGTSRYGFLAVGLLVTSSVVLALTIASRPSSSWVAVLAAPVLASAVLTVFGGRVVALTPVALGFIGARYLRFRHLSPGHAAERSPHRIRSVLLAAAVAFLILGYVAFVPQYRGGAGISALPAALSGSSLQDYAEFTIHTELGALHPYALALRMGPGTMQGSTYPGVLGVPGEVVGLEAERPGIALVEQLGPSAYREEWGFQTGLAIDVFLNSGLVAATLACLFFGAVLRAEYDGFRRAGPSLGTTFLHCFALWTLIWVYFESIVVLPSQIQVGLPTMLLIIFVAGLLPARRRGTLY